MDGEGQPAAEPVRVDLPSARGPIACLYHPGRTGAGGVLWMGGTDGGFLGPADGIYETMSEDLAARGVASLRLSFRILTAPGILEEAVFDALEGISYLRQDGVGPLALVGHSFGGAVAITAAVLSNGGIAGVATLATQSAGTQLAGRLAPTPLLLVHGSQDRRLPVECSRYVYRLAHQPKELLILEGARHSLRQRREEMRQLLEDWLLQRLSAAVTGSQG